jgi:hypothetical protein
MTGLKRRTGVYRINIALEIQDGRAFHLTRPFFCAIMQKMNVIFRAPSENIPRRRPKRATIPSRYFLAAPIMRREAAFF